MRVGWGSAQALADIAEGKPTDEIRRKWVEGKYGPEGERPTGSMMAMFLQLGGRSDGRNQA